MVRTKAMARHYLNQLASTWDRLDPCIPEPKMSRHSELRSLQILKHRLWTPRTFRNLQQFRERRCFFVFGNCIIKSLKEVWMFSLLVWAFQSLIWVGNAVCWSVLCISRSCSLFLNVCLVPANVHMISRLFVPFAKLRPLPAGDMARSAGGTIMQTSIQVYPSNQVYQYF